MLYLIIPDLLSQGRNALVSKTHNIFWCPKQSEDAQPLRLILHWCCVWHVVMGISKMHQYKETGDRKGYLELVNVVLCHSEVKCHTWHWLPSEIFVPAAFIARQIIFLDLILSFLLWMSSNLACVHIFISFSWWTFCFSCHIVAQGKCCWVLEEHKSVGVNPGFCYHDVAFILRATSNLMIYAENVTGSLAKWALQLPPGNLC